MHTSVEKVKIAVSKACEEFAVKRLEIFGSVVKEKVTSESDLDFIVEFEDETPQGYAKRFFGFQSTLEELFGTKVDLLTNDQIRNPYFKARVNQERTSVYG